MQHLANLYTHLRFLRPKFGTILVWGLLITSLHGYSQAQFPVLRSIRFNLNGNPQLQWIDAGNTGAYIQRYVQVDGRDYIKIDSIRTLTEYTDTHIQVNQGRVAYNLAPWIQNEGYPLSKHISMACSAYFSTCDDRIVCDFQAYTETMYEGSARWTTASYEVWGRNLPDSLTSTSETIPFSVWPSTAEDVFSLRAQAPVSSPFYQVQVRAVNSLGDTASSPYIVLRNRSITDPVRMQIDSVEQYADSITLHYQMDVDTTEMQWDIALFTSVDSLFIPLNTKKNKQSIVFPASFPRELPVQIEIRGLNLCSQVLMYTPPVSTLTVQCEQWIDGYHLTWQTHLPSPGVTYTIFRSLRNEPFKLLSSNFTQNNLTDALADLALPLPMGSIPVCYRITSHYPLGTKVIKHNPTCVLPSHEVILPNALAPLETHTNPITGKSRNLFEPVGTSIANFELLIIDKNGKIIYSGSAPWNGKLKNNVNFVMEGNYSYICKIRFYDDSRKSYSGTLTVVY